MWTSHHRTVLCNYVSLPVRTAIRLHMHPVSVDVGLIFAGGKITHRMEPIRSIEESTFERQIDMAVDAIKIMG